MAPKMLSSRGAEAGDNPPVGETPGKSWRGLQDHSNSCWHLHPDKAPNWWRDSQEKWKASKDKKEVNYYIILVSLWIKKSRIIHDKSATLPIKGVGDVTLQWRNRQINLQNCLFINLISPGCLDKKGCSPPPTPLNPATT
ncbi:hypothetical protein VP01_1412g2 [Puccinia sorghi]|uniref:Uncharacterized protein n=1 Tax=Puccinia sorghi TaxID=27349 RepID=A0A0L6VMM9_9BASI|nr:hypothetical protein VP01_1412g2 [Puccinia sorghi]